jgi:hypothetical protein
MHTSFDAKTVDGILINSSVFDRSNNVIGNIKDNNFQAFENVHSHIEQRADVQHPPTNGASPPPIKLTHHPSRPSAL